MGDERGAQNPAVRAAVEAFAAAPSQQTSFDVLRACLCGVLLYDGTGSQLKYRDGDPGVLEAGSTVRIATANGPDGRSALLAFTSHAEVARVPSGVLAAPTQLPMRVTTTPDGETALVAFSSGPEVVARHPEDAFVAQSTGEVLARVRAGGFAGLVLNPAGPWAFVPTDELPVR